MVLSLGHRLVAWDLTWSQHLGPGLSPEERETMAVKKVGVGGGWLGPVVGAGTEQPQ